MLTAHKLCEVRVVNRAAADMQFLKLRESCEVNESRAGDAGIWQVEMIQLRQMSQRLERTIVDWRAADNDVL